MNNIYIGNRYVPVFANPVEWDNLREYEPLTIVTYNGTAYTSRKTVPVGTELSNTEYWVVTGNYNAQVEEYRQEVVAVDGRVDDVNKRVDLLVNHKYIFIGDSYGHGSGNDGWMDVAINALGLTSGEYITNSLGGAGFAQSSASLKFITLLTEVASSMTATEKAEVTDIVVCGGANDIAQTEETLATAIQEFITYAKSTFPNAVIHIGDVAGSKDSTKIGVQYSRVARGYQMGSYGKNVHFMNNLMYCLNDRSLLGSDGVHPTTAGYVILGKAITQALYDGYNAFYLDNDKRVIADASAPHQVANSILNTTIENGYTTLCSATALNIIPKSGVSYFGISLNSAFEIGELTTELMYGSQGNWQRGFVPVTAMVTVLIGGETATNYDVAGFVYVSSHKMFFVPYDKVLGDTSAFNTYVTRISIPFFTISCPTLFC